LQEFAFIASHDLQEPLQKIQTFGSMLVKRYGESLAPVGRGNMERIIRGANRMSDLLRVLLNYSMTGTGRLNHSPVSLTDPLK
jgi:light-regulated signal transduction histidine kinase (bacteriophytochrome)